VRAIFNQGRAVPTPIAPEDARPDVVIVSHWHEDHLDPGTIPLIARHSPRTRFIMPPSALSRAVGWGVPRDRIQTLTGGESITIEGVGITHMPARHEAGIPGWEVPDAMGVVVRMGGVRVYHTGDTEYTGRLLEVRSAPPDVLMVCVNGMTGNMNPHEAALLAWQIDAGTIIPMHHLLWAGQDEMFTRAPSDLAGTYTRLGGRGVVVAPEVAKPIVLSRRAP
jgi:L-ascorbate metabolism protein UlaG (beta-lactamase superfamily)